MNAAKLIKDSQSRHGQIVEAKHTVKLERELRSLGHEDRDMDGLFYGVDPVAGDWGVYLVK